MKRKKWARGVAFALLCLVIIGLRLSHLDADPPLWKRIGDIFDEGIWLHNARNLVLYHRLMIDDLNQWVASPLMTLCWIGSFSLFGVNFFSARLVTCLFGIATIALVFLWLRSAGEKKAALWALILLGINSTFLMYNRVALIETPLIFFQTLTVALFFWGRRRQGAYLFAGTAFFLSLLVKPYPVFGGIILMLALWECWQDPPAERIRRSAGRGILFAAGALLPAIPYVRWVVLPNLDEYRYIFGLFAQKNFASTTASFVQSFIQQVLTLPHADLLGQGPVGVLWFGVLLFLLYRLWTTERSLPDILRRMRPATAYSVTWFFAGILIAQTTDFIDRRQVLFLVPLALVAGTIAASVQRGLKAAAAHITTTALSATGIGLVATLFCLLDRFTEKVVTSGPVPANTRGYLIAFLSIICLGFPLLFRARFVSSRKWRRLVPGFLLTTAAMLIVNKAAYLWGAEVFGLTRSVTRIQLSCVTLTGVLGLTATLLTLNISSQRILGSALRGLLGCYIVFCTTESAVAVMIPGTTLRDESKRLGTIIPETEPLGGSFAAELCIANRIFPLYRDYRTDQMRETINDRCPPLRYQLVPRTLNWDTYDAPMSVPREAQTTPVRLFPSLLGRQRFKVAFDVHLSNGPIVSYPELVKGESKIHGK